MKFTTIVAVTAVSAKHHHHDKSWMAQRTFFDDLIETSKCHYAHPEENMIDSVFFRKSAYAIHNSWVKGTTSDPKAHVIDEKCFGDWMDPMWAHNWDVASRLMQGDIWGVHHEDLKNFTNNMWDMIFENIKYCDVYRLMYEHYNWCMDNIETCKFHQGIWTNMSDNVFPLAG